MANARNNIFMTGLSGTIGKQMTLSQKAGSTIVGRKRGPSTIPATDEQLDIQDRFKIASRYAQSALLDPAIKALYEAVAKNGQTAYNVALADAFSPPEIKSINLTNFHGYKGDIIVIRAIDKPKVVSVIATIHLPSGQLLESGNAMPLPNGLDWAYTIISDDFAPAGYKLSVVATDLPANEALKEQLLAA